MSALSYIQNNGQQGAEFPVWEAPPPRPRGSHKWHSRHKLRHLPQTLFVLSRDLVLESSVSAVIFGYLISVWDIWQPEPKKFRRSVRLHLVSKDWKHWTICPFSCFTNPFQPAQSPKQLRLPISPGFFLHFQQLAFSEILWWPKKRRSGGVGGRALKKKKRSGPCPKLGKDRQWRRHLEIIYWWKLPSDPYLKVRLHVTRYPLQSIIQQREQNVK